MAIPAGQAAASERAGRLERARSRICALGSLGDGMAKGGSGETSTGTQLLDRAVAVLKYLSDNHDAAGASVATVAEALGLKQPTAHRIMVALERHELIERDRQTKRYRLGLALFTMGAQAADSAGLRRIAQPALMRLCALTGDTVFLMARNGLNTVCVDRHDGIYVIDSLTGGVGGQVPLGVGSASLAILAFLPVEEAGAIIDANAPLYPHYHGLSAERVRAALPAIHQNGYAIDQGELVAGISAFAVPIRPKGRDVTAALAINMTSARLTEDRLRELLPVLRHEVQLIEEIANPLETALRRRPGR